MKHIFEESDVSLFISDNVTAKNWKNFIVQRMKTVNYSDMPFHVEGIAYQFLTVLLSIQHEQKTFASIFNISMNLSLFNREAWVENRPISEQQSRNQFLIATCITT